MPLDTPALDIANLTFQLVKIGNIMGLILPNSTSWHVIFAKLKQLESTKSSISCMYSHLFDKHGGGAKVAKSLNGEVGINGEGGIFWKKLVLKSNK